MVKKVISVVADVISSFIWMVGLFTIYDYLDTHSPRLLSIILIVLLTVFAVTYLWFVVIAPFREGYRAAKNDP